MIKPTQLDKILTVQELEGLVELMKNNRQTIVFTNGCFDVLHPGHIDYLQKARKLGDLLLVAVNTDDSVRALKGSRRPVNKLEDRMTMLAALECVDFVVPFPDETPLTLIEKVTPHILVKGGDYKKENIVGAEYVEDHGGRVEIIAFLPGYSSTALIEKIKLL